MESQSALAKIRPQLIGHTTNLLLNFRFLLVGENVHPFSLQLKMKYFVGLRKSMSAINGLEAPAQSNVCSDMQSSEFVAQSINIYTWDSHISNRIIAIDKGIRFGRVVLFHRSFCALPLHCNETKVATKYVIVSSINYAKWNGRESCNRCDTLCQNKCKCCSVINLCLWFIYALRLQHFIALEMNKWKMGSFNVFSSFFGKNINCRTWQNVEMMHKHIESNWMAANSQPSEIELEKLLWQTISNKDKK